MLDLVPNIFCNKCQNTYAIPHECGKDKPVEFDAVAKDPNSRPAAAKNVEDMTDAEVEELKQRLAKRELKDTAKTACRIRIRESISPDDRVFYQECISKGYVTAVELGGMLMDAV